MWAAAPVCNPPTERAFAGQPRGVTISGAASRAPPGMAPVRSMKKHAAKTPTRQDFRQQIRQAGLRSTTARVAVLKQLQRATAPMSHAELAEAIVPLGFDRATVYRNLMDLTEAGLVARGEYGDHVWRFELQREAHRHSAEHPHFVCTACGEVSCLTNVNVSITPLPGTQRSLMGSVSEILLKGRCARCG